MKNKVAALLTPVVFLLLIFGFAVWNQLTPDKLFSEIENKNLTQRPNFSWDGLVKGKFTDNVNKWLTDQFCWRDGFVGVKTMTEYVLGKRDTNGIYFAADGYLIEKHTIPDFKRDDYEKNRKHFTKFVNAAAAELGTEHVRVMIAPTAGEVLRDKLPYGAPELSQATLLAKTAVGVPPEVWVDLLPVMEGHKDEYIYYKTDHHWTTDGAYYAYRAYCESVGIAPWDRDQFKIEAVSDQFWGTLYSKARLWDTPYDEVHAYVPKQPLAYSVEFNLGERRSDSLFDPSWLAKKDKYSYFLGGNDGLVTIHGPVKNGKTLLLVKDSYANCMAPFLANEYETIQMVDLRYFNLPLIQYMREQKATDVLVLYNAVTFSTDQGVLKMDKGV